MVCFVRKNLKRGTCLAFQIRYLHQILLCKRFPLNHTECMYARVDEGCAKQGGKDERVTAVLLARGMNLLQRKSQVINHSVTMEEGWLRNVDGVGWLAAQNEATANQMCSAVCVLPLLCAQPVAYPNCIAWSGLWEAEGKARAQLTFFHFTVCFISSHSSFASSYTLVLHTEEKIFGSDPGSYFWLLRLVLAAQPTLSNLLILHCQHLGVHLKKYSENKIYTHSYIRACV